jgi:hypothetical protein
MNEIYNDVLCMYSGTVPFWDLLLNVCLRIIARILHIISGCNHSEF